MCGRFVSTSTRAELEAEFAIDHIVGPDRPPSWNIAPTQEVRVIAERYDDVGASEAGASIGQRVRGLISVRWGLVPHWAKDPAIGSRMINARSETVTEKPAYRTAAARRRCLIPADGYYEWVGQGGAKTPYFLYDPRSPILAMAGLYEAWRDPALAGDHPDAIRWTCTVITRSAPDDLGHLYDRSPVIVPRDMRADWLDPAITERGDVQELLAAIPPPRLHPRQIGSAVGHVRNNWPELLDGVSDAAS